MMLLKECKNNLSNPETLLALKNLWVESCLFLFDNEESSFHDSRPFQNQIQSQDQILQTQSQTGSGTRINPYRGVPGTQTLPQGRESAYLDSNLELRIQKLELQVQKQNDLTRRLLTAYLRDSGKFLTDVNAALAMNEIVRNDFVS